MKKTLIHSLVLIVMFLNLWGQTTDTRAAVLEAELGTQTSQTNCYSLDVVFIIDQSGSMAGQNGVVNDPTDQREWAPKGMIDLLSDIALDQCPDAHHRMAVISFGTEARVDLPLRDINPDTLDEALRIREDLKKYISADDLGATNPKLAFELAVDILDDASPLSGEGIRKRVVIYVTDGEPCVPNLGCNPPNTTMDFDAYVRGMRDEINLSLPFDPVLLQQEICLDGLFEQYGDIEAIPAEEKNACLDQFNVSADAYQNSTYIYLVFLKFGETYSNRLRAYYEEIAEGHAGNVYDLTESRNDIPTLFRIILTRLAGVKATRLSCGNFAVNPYLRKATIVFYKFDAEIKVTLSYTDSQGKRHEITAGQPGSSGGFDVDEYYQYGANERYVFDLPYPGIWQLQSENCDGLDAFYDPVKINASGYQLSLPTEIAQYDREPFYDQAQPYYLEYQMKDEGNDVIPQADFPEFAVQFQVVVTDPLNVAFPYSMQWVASEQLFRSTTPLQVKDPGEYSVSIYGSTLEHQGEPSPVGDSRAVTFDSTRDLFSHTGLTFSVFPVTPFTFEVLSPEPNQLLSPVHGTIREGWPLPVYPFSIRARITDEQGSLFPDLADILINPTEALMATVTTGGEQPQSQSITLIPDPSHPGEYTGEFNDFAALGEYQLVVKLQSGYSAHYRPLIQQTMVGFQRGDGTWNLATTYYIILVILIALFLLWIAYNVRIRNNKIGGELVFWDGSTQLASFGLKSGKNWRDISPRELKNNPMLMLKRVRVTNLGKPGKHAKTNREAEDAVSGPMFNTGPSGVRVQCVTTTSNRRFTVELTPDLPTTYSSDTMAQMEYKPD